jgi:hypothetical protein
MSNLVVAVAFTKNSGEPATGLTLTDITLYLTARNKSTGALTVVWDGTETAESEVTNTGIYTRVYASADLNTYDYFARGSYGGVTVLDTSHVMGAYDSVGPDVWGNTIRTLTQSAAAVVAAVSGSDITILRGDSWSATLTGLGDISARTKLWFTVKNRSDHTDSEAIVQIEETAGLVYLNGAAGTPAAGDITVNDEVTGSITITLTAAATAALTVRSGLLYDVQMLTASGVTTLTAGTSHVTADVTHAIV